MKYRLILIPTWFVVAILLISCNHNQRVPSYTESASPTSFHTMTPIAPTEQPKWTATLESTATRPPLKTPTPTVTFLPTSTIPQETLFARQTMEPFLPLCSFSSQVEMSPDRNWIVSYPCPGDSEKVPFYLMARNMVDGRIWRVDFDTEKFGYYDGYIWPSHWTQDGRFVYVAIIKQMDGSGVVLITATLLVRLNLKTGELIEIFPDGFHTFSFSPSDQLAYISARGISILDTHTWKSKEYPLEIEYCKIGNIQWSPTEKQIIFQTRECREGGFEYLSYNLNLLNLNDGIYEQISKSKERIPRFLQWQGQYPIYGTVGTHLSRGECFELKLDTKEWQPIECP